MIAGLMVTNFEEMTTFKTELYACFTKIIREGHPVGNLRSK